MTSSANIVVVSTYDSGGRSFIRTKKSIGPKMVPCETPVLKAGDEPSQGVFTEFVDLYFL